MTKSETSPTPSAPESAVRIVTIGDESILVAKLPRKFPEDSANLIGKIIFEPSAGGGGLCCDNLCGIN